MVCTAQVVHDFEHIVLWQSIRQFAFHANGLIVFDDLLWVFDACLVPAWTNCGGAKELRGV